MQSVLCSLWRAPDGLCTCTCVHALLRRPIVQPCALPCRSPNARKRLAVPYRAALTPSERSEYARPDTALTLTDLAYYKDGLSPGEFLDALHELLKRGQNEQRACYAEWLQLARRDVEDAGGHNGLLVLGRAVVGCLAAHLPLTCLHCLAFPDRRVP